MDDCHVYPVAVIGGGSAGTMAVLRTVLNNDETIFFPGTGKDKKRSRAFWVSKVENMPGHLQYSKGIEQPNRESLEWLHQSEFRFKFHWKKNLGITKLEKLDDGTFNLIDNHGVSYRARYVILATGVMDIQPEINGTIEPVFPYANVQLVDYCLRCDGHHILHKHASVIGHDSGAAWVSIMLYERYSPPSMTIFTNGKEPQWDEDTSALVKRYGIKIAISPIKEMKGNHKEHRLDGFLLEDGSFHQTQISFVSLGMMVYNELAKMVGAELDKRGFVITDSLGHSSVEGLYVAGDLRAGTKKQIYTAWDGAVDSADRINALIRLQKRCL